MKKYSVTFKLSNDKKPYTLNVWAANREVIPVKLSIQKNRPISEITIVNIKELPIAI